MKDKDFEAQHVFQEDEINLLDILRVIRKRKWIVIIFFLIIFTVVSIYTFSKTPIYRGECKVLIEQSENSNSIASRTDSARLEPDFLQTQFQVIKSRRVALRVVELLHLEENWEKYLGNSENDRNLMLGILGWGWRVKESTTNFVDSFGAEDKKKKTNTAIDNASSNAEELPLREKLATMISKKIVVEPVKFSRVAMISYTSPNPQFAALVANTVAKAYTEEMLEIKMDTTRQTIGWMSSKAEEERKKLDVAEKKMQDYMQANEIVTLENRVTVLPQRLSELSTYLVRAETERKQLEDMYNLSKKYENNLDMAESLGPISENLVLKNLRDQIVLAERNIMVLSSKYGPQHPEMAKAVTNLDILKKKREDEIKIGLQYIKNNYELSRSKENSIRAQIEKTKGEALSLNSKVIQNESIKKEVETSSQLYNALMTKLKEKVITEKTDPVSLSIIETAQVPVEPISPKVGINLLIGIFIGLFGGIGLVLLLDYLDNTVKDPDETERILKTSVMGVIPEGSSKQKNIEFIVKNDPLSVFAESYKSLRTSVVLSSVDIPPKSILVTSSVQSEGKTTTAINLAISLSMSDKKVLLIDADLRKPRIHKVFQLENRTGLSNFLAGNTDLGVQKTGGIENLDVLTSGPIPPNPSELLTSNNMKVLMESASEQYDFIIVDSAPLLAVADSVILSKHMDGTILVVKAHDTKYDFVKKSLRYLNDVNSKVFGLLINGLNVKKSDYYYNYYYSAYGEHVKSNK